MKQVCFIKKTKEHEESNMLTSELKNINRFRMKTIYILLLFFFSSMQLFAQERVITGIVTDETGAGLPGATVVLKGTTKGTVTDVDGKYQISVPQTGGTIQVSFVGYASQEKEIGTASTIDVSLTPDVKSLNEVVVVGYGVQKKSDITGAVASVKREDIAKMPAATTDQILQGRAAGVSITSNSGSPGSSFNITVRGIGTINDASPLFVVDGFPVDDIKFLNTSDIETLEVLKDASACAIYGARGANGVILITTKNGKAGEPILVNIDSYYGISEMWKEPKLLNASQWAMLKNEALINANLAPIDTLLNYKNFGTGTNWINEVTRKAATKNINASVTGSSEKITYFISANSFTQEGIVKKSDFERYSFRLNSSIKVKEWLNIGENMTIEKSKTRRINEDDEWNAVMIQASTLDPLTKVYTPNGNFAYSPYVQMNNPVGRIEHTNADDQSLRILGNIYGELQFFKFLTFKSNLGLSSNNGKSYNFDPTYHVSPTDKNELSKLSKGSTEDKSWSWSNYINYSQEIGNHNIDALLGYEASHDYYEWFGTQVTGLLSEEEHLRYIDNATNRQAASSYGSITEKTMQSYFGRLNYSFANKYLLTANIRRDGSSYFGKDNQYGIFPSFSLGWKVIEEDFMKGLTFISNLKLRVGWGQNGNDKIGAYGYSTQSSSGMRYPFGNVITDGSAFQTIANSELHWEASTTQNMGIDLGLLKNRLTFSLDVYQKETSDMLVNAPTQGHVGLQIDPWSNVGKMENKGLEFELTYKDNVGDLGYETSLTFATYTNKVTDLGGKDVLPSADLRDAGFVTMTKVGHPVAQFWGRKTDGLFQNQAEINAHKDNNGNLLQPNAKPGDIRYAKGEDGNLYLGFIGNPLPDFTFGFNSNLNYKSFDLVMFFQGAYGNDIFNGTKVYTERPDATHNMSVKMLNRWTGEGSTNDAHYPRLDASNSENIIFSDRYVEDGSYIRLKNIQLGYTLPEKLSKYAGIKKLRVYVGATNLLTFTKYSGFDPEIGEGYDGSLDLGVDRATYPQSRTYLFGLNLSF